MAGFGDRMLTTDTLFEQPTLGPRIAVIGMGPLGWKWPKPWHGWGCRCPPSAQATSSRAFATPPSTPSWLQVLKADMRLYTGAPAELREVAGGIEVRSGNQTVVVDQVVAAMGRTPNIEHLRGWKPWACRWMNGACRP